VYKVWFPHAIKYRCTRRAAICSLSIMACCLLAVNSHILYGIGDDVQDMNGTRTVNQCTYVSKSYKEFFTLSWPWIYLTVFFLVPFCLLFIGNLLIIFFLYLLATQHSCKFTSKSRATENIQYKTKGII
jgi:ABC-type protease/lipase transport system fused ATPase/permease subunit